MTIWLPKSELIQQRTSRLKLDGHRAPADLLALGASRVKLPTFPACLAVPASLQAVVPQVRLDVLQVVLRPTPHQLARIAPAATAEPGKPRRRRVAVALLRQREALSLATAAGGRPE